MGTTRSTRTLGLSLAILTLFSGVQLGLFADVAEAAPISGIQAPNLPGLPAIAEPTSTTSSTANPLPREFLDAYEIANLDASLSAVLANYARKMNVPTRDIPLRDVPASGALPDALADYTFAIAPFTTPAHLTESQGAAAALPDDLQAALARLLYAMIDAQDLQMEAIGKLTPFEVQALRSDTLDGNSLTTLAGKVDLSKTLDAANLLDKAVAEAEPVLKKWSLLTSIHRRVEGPGVSDSAILAATAALVEAETPADVFKWTAALRGARVPDVNMDVFKELASVPPSQALAVLYQATGTPIGPEHILSFLAAEDLHPNLKSATSVLVLSTAAAQLLVQGGETTSPLDVDRAAGLAAAVAGISQSAEVPTSADLDTLRAFDQLLQSSASSGNSLAAAAILLKAAEVAEAYTLDIPEGADLRPYQTADHGNSDQDLRVSGIRIMTHEYPNNHTTRINVRVPLLGVNETYHSRDKVVYNDDGKCRMRAWHDQDEDGNVDGNERATKTDGATPRDNQLFYFEQGPTCDASNGIIFHDPYFYVMILDNRTSVIDGRHSRVESDAFTRDYGSFTARDLRDVIWNGWNATFNSGFGFEELLGTEFLGGALCASVGFGGGDACDLTGDGNGFNPAFLVPTANVTLNRQAYQFVLLDLGGDDVYRNNAGGTYNQSENGDPFRGGLVAVHLDLDGHDKYASQRAFSLGSADAGVGILLDRRGDDQYSGRDRILGSANYTQHMAGTFFDQAGFCFAVNFGSPGSRCEHPGLGLFFDLAGNDTYTATKDSIGFANNSYTNAFIFPAFTDPAAGSEEAADNARSYGLGSLGLFYDHSGTDSYAGTHHSQGVGNNSGLGVLIDRSGDDSYSFTGNSNVTQGKGVHRGFGLLFDLDGADRGLQKTGEVSIAHVAQVDFDVRAFHKWKAEDSQGGSSVRSPYAHGYGLILDVDVASNPATAFQAEGSGSRTAPGATLEMQEDPFFGLEVYIVIPGALAIGTPESNTWRSNWTLLIDLGGDDRYTNRAGAASLDWTTFTSTDQTHTLYPLGMDNEQPFGAQRLLFCGQQEINCRDRRPSTPLYLANPTSNRTGFTTLVGIAIDVDGADHYRNVGPNGTFGEGLGYGLGGIGLLYDYWNGGGSKDAYESSGKSLGVGEVFGIGAFYDESGDDRYDVRLHRDADPKTNKDKSWALAYAERGGIGVFLDPIGNDYYRGYNVTAGAVRTTFNVESAVFYDGSGVDTYLLGNESQGYLQNMVRRSAPSGFQTIFGAGERQCYHNNYVSFPGSNECTPNNINNNVNSNSQASAILALFLDDGPESDLYADNLRFIKTDFDHGHDNNKWWRHVGEPPKGAGQGTGTDDPTGQGGSQQSSSSSGESFGFALGVDNSDYYSNTRVHALFNHPSRGNIGEPSDSGAKVWDDFSLGFYPEFFVLRSVLLSPAVQLAVNGRGVAATAPTFDLKEESGSIAVLDWQAYYGTQSVINNAQRLTFYLLSETAYRFTCGVYADYRSLVSGQRAFHEPRPDAYCALVDQARDVMSQGSATASAQLKIVLDTTFATIAGAQSTNSQPRTFYVDLAKAAESASVQFRGAPYLLAQPAFESLAVDARAVAQGDADPSILALDVERLKLAAAEIVQYRESTVDPSPLVLTLLASAMELQALTDPDLRLRMESFGVTDAILDAAAASFDPTKRDDALTELAHILEAAGAAGGEAGDHDQGSVTTDKDGSKVRSFEIWVARDLRAWWDNTCGTAADCIEFSPVARCDNTDPHKAVCEWREPEAGPNGTWHPAPIGCSADSDAAKAVFCKEGKNAYKYRWNVTEAMANGTQRWPDSSVGRAYEFVAYAHGQMNQLDSEWKAYSQVTSNLGRADDVRRTQAWRLDDNYGYYPGTYRVAAAFDSFVYTNPKDIVVKHFNPTFLSQAVEAQVHTSEPVVYYVDYRQAGASEWILGKNELESRAMNPGVFTDADRAGRNNIKATGDWLDVFSRPAGATEGRYEFRLRYLDQTHRTQSAVTSPRGTFVFDAWADAHTPVARFENTKEWINLGDVRSFNGIAKSGIITVNVTGTDQDPHTLANGGSPLVSWTIATTEFASDCATAGVTTTKTVEKPHLNVTVRHGRCYVFNVRALDGAGNMQPVEAADRWTVKVDLVAPIANVKSPQERMHPDTPVVIPYTLDSKESVYGNDIKRVELWYNVTTNTTGPAGYTRVTEYPIEPLTEGVATFDLRKVKGQFDLENADPATLDKNMAYVLVVPVDEAGNMGGFNYAFKSFTAGSLFFPIDTTPPSLVGDRPGIDPQYYRAKVRWSFDETVNPDSVRIEWGLPADFEGPYCVEPVRCPPKVKATTLDNLSFTGIIPGLQQDRSYRFSIHVKDLVGNPATFGPFDFDAEPVVELKFVAPTVDEVVRGTVGAKFAAHNLRRAPGDAATEAKVTYNVTLVVDDDYAKTYPLGEVTYVERRDAVNPTRTFLFDSRVIPDTLNAKLLVRITTDLNAKDPIERESPVFAIDNNPPVVVPVFTPAPTGPWFARKVTLDFAAEDGVAGGPVTHVSFTNRTGSFTVLKEPIIFDQEGVHTVYYYAVDALGNAGKARPVTFSIDRTNPLARVRIDENADATADRQVTLQIEASDALSGVESITITTDGDSSTITGNRLRDGFLALPWLLGEGDGIKDVTIVVSDLAGNSITARDSILLDMTPPRLSPSGLVWNPVGFASATLAFETSEASTAVVLTKRSGDPAFGSPRESLALRTTHRIGLDDLAPSTSYEVKVLLEDRLGNPAVYYSNVTTRTDVTPPTIPAALRVLDTGFGYLNVTWVASEDNVGVFRYAVERSSDEGRTWLPAGFAYTTHFLDDDVTPGVAYAYRVRAEDRAQNAGPMSGTTTGTATTVPALLTGAVSPKSGTLRETFTYSVVYRDLDGDRPVYVRAVVNGDVFDMQPALTGDPDYRTGVRYVYRTQLAESRLSAGMNTFVFEASDGKTAIRAPSLMDGVGPAVLSSGPGSLSAESAEEGGFFGTVRELPTPGAGLVLVALAALALVLRRRWSE